MAAWKEARGIFYKADVAAACAFQVHAGDRYAGLRRIDAR